MQETDLPSNTDKILDQFLRTSNDLICITDKSWKFTLVSDSIYKILGYRKEEVLNQPYTKFLHPEDYERSTKTSQFIAEGNQIYDFENRYIHKNGSIVYLQWSSQYDAEQETFFSIARDITQQSEKINEENQQQRINTALINGTNSLVWSIDKDYKLTGFNKAFADDVRKDYGREVRIGRPVLNTEIFPPPVIAFWEDMYSKVFKGEKVLFEFNTSEIKGLDDHQWFRVHLRPIRNEQGDIIGCIATSTNITELKETANILDERNKLIETVITEIPMGIAVNEINTGKAVFRNNKFSEIYNWPDDTLTDVTTFLNKIYPPNNEESQKYKQQIIEDLESGDPKRMEWHNIPVMGQNNKFRYVNAKNIPIFDQNLMISTVQNNTENYLNKKEIEVSYLEKNEILNSISDAFYTLDSDYNFLFLNKHSLEIMNMTADQLLGKNLFQIFPELKHTIFYEHLETVKESGKSSKFEFYYELFDKWFDERIYKTPTGFSIFFVDITIKKNFSLRLESAYAKQNEILESITDSFISLDYRFNFTYVNKEAENVFNLKKKELLGKNLFSILHLDRVTDLHEKFKITLHSKIPSSFEYFFEPSQTWFEVNAYPSENGLSIYFRDITIQKTDQIELNKLNNSLKQKNEELEQFAFVASHDLQEPLRIITSFLDLLKKQLGDKLDENSHKYIEYSIDGSKRMRQIIMDLLDYSRAGSDEEGFQLIDCNKLVNEVKLLLEESIQQKNASLIVDNLPEIQHNHTALRQVFMNLIGNALKYVKNGTEPIIKISCKEENAEYVFSISDNGIGIEQKYFKKIFTIFKRLHNRSEYSGTGIGLAITKKIIEKYGGRIYLESTLNKGTTFYFTVPKSIHLA